MLVMGFVKGWGVACIETGNEGEIERTGGKLKKADRWSVLLWIRVPEQ